MWVTSLVLLRRMEACDEQTAGARVWSDLLRGVLPYVSLPAQPRRRAAQRDGSALVHEWTADSASSRARANDFVSFMGSNTWVVMMSGNTLHFRRFLQ